jgi:hypothetical protein
MTEVFMNVVDGQPDQVLLLAASEDSLPVAFTDRPADTILSVADGYAYVVSGQAVVQQWSVRPRTDAEVQNLKQLPHASDLPLVIEASTTYRAQRDQFLRDNVDTINPMRWESMSSEQQTAWRAYRAALLDVPQQPDFPWSVTWPEAPTT